MSLGLVVAAGLWFIVLTAWAVGGLHHFGEVAFFLVAASAAAYVVTVAVALARGHGFLRAARRVAIVAVLFLVPLVFDLTASTGWNAPKLAVTAIGASAVAGLWAVEWAGTRARPLLRHGLHWPVLAFLAWTAIATVTSVSPWISLLGHYDYFDGLALLVCMVVLCFSTAADFRLADVRALLSALYLGAGSVVVFYGLEQLHDRLTTVGGRMEWAYRLVNLSPTGSPFDPTRQIWSTLGNPNRLSGLLAVLLPIGFGLFVLADKRRTRLAIALVGAGGMIELVQSTTRGALLAAVASVVIVGLVLMRQVRIGVRQAALAALVILGVVTLTAAMSVSGHTRYSVSQVTGNTGSAGTTATERVEYWRAALRIAAAHPILGSGPDTYENELAGVQSARLVSLMGAEAPADGPHNILLDYLSNLGIPGVVCFLAMLAEAAWLVWQARRAMIAYGADRAGDARSIEGMILLAAVAGALSAFVVQASFDLNQVPLLVTFWILLGVLCVVATDARGLRPPSPAATGRTARRRPRPATGDAVLAPQLVVGSLVVVATVVVALLAVRPYRAAKEIRRAAAYVLATNQAASGKDVQAAHANYQVAASHLAKAKRLDPYDPLFLEAEGEFLVYDAGFGGLDVHNQLDAYRRADADLRRAAELDPGNARAVAWRAGGFGVQYSVTHDPSALAQEIRLLRRAVQINPRAAEYPISLSWILFNQGATQDALAVIRQAMTSLPTDKDLRRAEQQLANGQAPTRLPVPIVAALGG